MFQYLNIEESKHELHIQIFKHWNIPPYKCPNTQTLKKQPRQGKKSGHKPRQSHVFVQ